MRERIVIIAVSVVVALAVVVGLVAYVGWYTLFRMSPGPFDGPNVSEADYFKYGTIGIEPTAGIPYWVWVVLPEVFPELLPRPGATPLWAWSGRPVRRLLLASPGRILASCPASA
jgi:hypothetical protein